MLDYCDEFKKLEKLKPDWNSYGSNPPNELALQNGRLMILYLLLNGLEPDKISPDAEDGIAIYLCKGRKRVWISCFNSGWMGCCCYFTNEREVSSPIIWEFENLFDNNHIEKIKSYLEKGTICSNELASVEHKEAVKTHLQKSL